MSTYTHSVGGFSRKGSNILGGFFYDEAEARRVAKELIECGRAASATVYDYETGEEVATYVLEGR